MTRAIKNLTACDKTNVLIFKLLFCGVLAVSSLYVYFVVSAITATIDGKQGNGIIQEMSQEYYALESKYVNLIGKFDIDYANQLGFVSQGEKLEYITRNNAFARR